MYHARVQDRDAGVLAMMIKTCSGLLGLAMVAGSAFALDETEIGDVVLRAYPGARIDVIQREIHRGEEVFGVQFRHGGEDISAKLSIEGQFIKVRAEN
jgi:hypothetical protein